MIARSPPVGVAEAARLQIHPTDLAVFNLDISGMGGFCEGVQTSLCYALLVMSYHLIGSPLQPSRRGLLHQREDPTAFPFSQAGLVT